MKPRLQDVLEKLDPPKNGLARLRERLAEAETPRTTSPLRPLAWIGAAAAAAAIAMVVVLSAIREPATRSTSASEVAPPAAPVAAAPASGLLGTHPAFAALGLEPLPVEPVTVAAANASSLALQRVPVADDRVVFYLVASVVPAGALAPFDRSASPNAQGATRLTRPVR
jgi:hypothetical protein